MGKKVRVETQRLFSCKKTPNMSVSTAQMEEINHNVPWDYICLKSKLTCEALGTMVVQILSLAKLGSIGTL